MPMEIDSLPTRLLALNMYYTCPKRKSWTLPWFCGIGLEKRHMGASYIRVSYYAVEFVLDC